MYMGRKDLEIVEINLELYCRKVGSVLCVMSIRKEGLKQYREEG